MLMFNLKFNLNAIKKHLRGYLKGAITNQHLGFGLMAAGGALAASDFVPDMADPLGGAGRGTRIAVGGTLAAVGFTATILNGKI